MTLMSGHRLSTRHRFCPSPFGSGHYVLEIHQGVKTFPQTSAALFVKEEPRWNSCGPSRR